MRARESDNRFGDPSILSLGVLVSFAIIVAVLLEITLFFLYYVPFFVVSSVIILPFVLWDFSKAKLSLYLFLLLWIAILYLIPSSPRKPFLRDLKRVKQGMTFDQVEAIMGNYIKGTGWPPHPQSTSGAKELQFEGKHIYRHSETGNYDSDWGIITYENGHVASVEFSPD